jgi:hypothetical protein
MTQEQKPTVEELEAIVKSIGQIKPHLKGAGGSINTSSLGVICKDALPLIEYSLTQVLEIAKGDKVVVRKSDIAKAMVCVATSDDIEDTVWLDEFITLYEHLATIGEIDGEIYNDIIYLRAMIAVAEGE